MQKGSSMIMRTVLLLALGLTTFYVTTFAEVAWQLYDDSEMARVDITCEPGVMEWLYQPENVQSDSLHLATIHFSNATIDEDLEDVGFRLRGNTSRVSRKKSFKLSFNGFVPGREFYDVDKLNLNGEHNDPSIVRSKLCWDLYQQTDIPASRAAHSEVWVNDMYAGLYVSVEHIDDEFLWKHMDDDSGNLWKCLWPSDLSWQGDHPDNYKMMQGDRRVYELKTNEDADDYSALYELIRMLHQCPDAALEDSLGQYMDIAGLLQYLAMNVITGNWDDHWFLKNNFYLYHDPSLNRMQLIPYDYDNSFGVDWFDVEWAQRNPYHFGTEARPLVDRVLASPRWRDLYTHFLTEWNEKLLDEALWDERLDELYTRSAPSALADSFRCLDYDFTNADFSDSWGMSYENSHVKRGLREFIHMRTTSLPDQLIWYNGGPEAWALNWEPRSPSGQDSILVHCAAFSYRPDPTVSLRWRLNGAEWQLLNMTYTGDPSSPRFSLSDRYSCTLPPVGTASLLELQILVEDDLGRTRLSPPLEPRALHFATPPTGLALNEFLARNDSQGQDEAGEFDDWLEIVNITYGSLEIAECFLSDDPDDLLKWEFPSDTPPILPGECLLVWCDEDDDQGSLHCNFKLSGSGEFLALTGPDGSTVLDSLTFGPQETDISWGRLPDGVGAWQALEQPSPGALNQATGVHEPDVSRRSFALKQNFPNPFNPTTTIQFSLTQSDFVTLSIFNPAGQLVSTLVEGLMGTGHHSVVFDGSNLTSGVYFYRLNVDGSSLTKKLVLIK
jgi:hypothetical protein